MADDPVKIAREYVAAYDSGDCVALNLGPTLGQIRDVFTALIAEHERAERLHQALRELFEETGWPEGGDIDAFWFQEWAIKHGFLRPEQRYAPCLPDCHCGEYHDPDEFERGVTCYRKADFLLAAPQAKEGM